jgi:hypothetical protein
MCWQNGDIITLKTNASDTFSATQYKDKQSSVGNAIEGVIANETSSRKIKL